MTVALGLAAAGLRPVLLAPEKKLTASASAASYQAVGLLADKHYGLSLTASWLHSRCWLARSLWSSG